MPKATSLERHGVSVTVNDVLAVYLSHMEQLMNRYQQQGWDSFFAQQYNQHCLSIGAQVTWVVEGRSIKGKALKVDEHGVLHFEDDTGVVHKVLSGDIINDAEQK